MLTYIEDFGDYLVDTKNVSTNTLQSYMRDVEQFVKYFSAKPAVSSVDVSTDDIKKYIDSLKTSGKSDSSLVRMLASLRCYYSYLVERGIAASNPAVQIKSVKKASKLPQILDTAEIDLLMNQPDVSEPKGCRDKAMLELLYATGIRVSELIDLNYDDINLQVGILHCRNSKNERIIPIYPEALEVIGNYIEYVRGVMVLDYNEKALFVNMNGTRLTRQGFWKIIKHYTAQAKIKKDITPHTLRHSFAAHLLENGAQLKDIKEMMGHSDISSTQIYAQVIRNKYRDVYASYHPKAKHS